MAGERETKFNRSLDKFLGDLVASRSFWLLMSGIWLSKVNPTFGAICAVSGLALMRHDTLKMERK